MEKLEISPDANNNYLAKIIKIDNIRKHENADSLQIVTIDFQDVIVGGDYNKGDLCVFFPLECQINANLLKEINAYREKEYNKDKTIAGFFEKNARVRAVKLRGHKSMGFLLPLQQLELFVNASLSTYINTSFDTINGIQICKKYMIREPQERVIKNGKKPQISRLIDGQVHLHVETDNLRNCAQEIKPEDDISITYKLHGTSFWVSNVLVKKHLTLIEKILKKLRVNIDETEWDYVYGSRRVVKNQAETQHTNDYYDGDLWGTIKEEIKDKIPKGYTLYGECVGFTDTNKFIQQKYDYGCEPNQHKLYIYRITITNRDGLVYNLSTKEIKDFCDKNGLNYVPLFYIGKAKDKYKIRKSKHWNINFIKELEKEYNDKNCYICKNEVPEEGIVIRKEDWMEFKTYKLKSFAFLEHETKLLDEGISDIESNN